MRGYIAGKSDVFYFRGYKEGKEKGLNDTVNKIKAEIQGKYRIVLKNTPKDDWNIKWNECIDEVLEVIDKYKVETDKPKSEEYI